MLLAKTDSYRCSNSNYFHAGYMYPICHDSIHPHNFISGQKMATINSHRAINPYTLHTTNFSSAQNEIFQKTMHHQFVTPSNSNSPYTFRISYFKRPTHEIPYGAYRGHFSQPFNQTALKTNRREDKREPTGSRKLGNQTFTRTKTARTDDGTTWARRIVDRLKRKPIRYRRRRRLYGEITLFTGSRTACRKASRLP